MKMHYCQTGPKILLLITLLLAILFGFLGLFIVMAAVCIPLLIICVGVLVY